MILNSHFFRRALATGAVLAMAAFGAQAAPTLDIQNGVLVGAFNVQVGNQSYDVRFVDGSCAGLYSGCDAAGDFVFDTKKEANAATAALLRDVLVDGVGHSFDSDPDSVTGCGASRCAIFTPYARSGGRVNLVAAMNTGGRDRSNNSRSPVARDTTANGRATYAVWSIHTEGGSSPAPTITRFVAPQLEVLAPPSQDIILTDDRVPGTVSEPGLLALVGLAIPLLGWSRRRRQAAARVAV